MQDTSTGVSDRIPSALTNIIIVNETSAKLLSHILGGPQISATVKKRFTMQKTLGTAAVKHCKRVANTKFKNIQIGCKIPT